MDTESRRPLGRLAAPPSRGASARCRAGACSYARARARRDGRARAHRDRARPARAGCRWTAPRPRAMLDRHGLRLVGGFVPVVVHEPDLAATREHARRGRRAARRRPAPSVFVAAAVQDAAWSRRVALDDDGWKRARRAPRRARGDRRRARASSSCCTPTSARSSRPAPTSSARSPTPTCRWCFDTGHLLIGGVDPVALRPRPRRAHRPRPPQGRRRRAGGARARGRAVARRRPTQAGLFRPLGERGRAHRRGRRPPRRRRATSAGSCSSRTSPSPGRSPRSAAARRRCRKSIEFLSTLAPEEREVSTDEATRSRSVCALRSALVVPRRRGQLRRRQQGRARPRHERRQRRTLDAGQRPDVRDGHPPTRARSGRSSRRAPSRRPRTRASSSIWSPSNNDPQKQAQLIDAAVSQKVDGLAVSVPNADAIKGSLAKAHGGRHPDHHAQLRRRRLHGARRDHPRRPDRGDRRPGGGRAAQGRRAPRRCSASSTSRQHRPRAALRRRQGGLRRRRSTNLQVKGTDGHRDDADRDQVQAAGRQVLRRRHHAQPGHRRRRRDRRSRARARTRSSPRSTSARTSSRTSRPARSLFAVDQQQYLQGYLPIVFLKLFKTNANTVGGGQPVLTGPGFVDKSRERRRPVAERCAGRPAHAADRPMERRTAARRRTPATPRTRAAAEPVATSGWPKISPLARLLRRPEIGALLGRDRRRDLLLDAELAVPASSTASRTGPTSRRRSASWRSSSRC